MTVDFYFRDGTHPGVQRVKALLEVQEKRLQAAINRDHDREVGKIAIYRSRAVYVYNCKYDLYKSHNLCALATVPQRDRRLGNSIATAVPNQRS